MTIKDAIIDIAVAAGANAADFTGVTKSDAIDFLTDTLAGSDVDKEATIAASLGVLKDYVDAGVDVSDSTLETADQVANGITAYNKSGVKLTGTMTGGDAALIDFIEGDSYTIPDGTTKIRTGLFTGTAIESITIPEGVTEIGMGAFTYCASMTSASLPSTLTTIGENGFSTCPYMVLTELPDSITSIGTRAFRECASMTISALPSSLTSVGANAFQGCESIATMTIPSGVTALPQLVFGYCTALTSVTFEGTPDSIASNVFYECANLTTINVPWAENAVANAPWGATNATITYNYDPNEK